MSILTFVFRELKFRRLNFLLSVAAIAAAGASLAGAWTRLEAHHHSTTHILNAREEESAKRHQQLEVDMRKITLQLQFNIVILSKNQNKNDFLLNHFADTTMPESYVTQLAKSDLTAINHLEPSLTQKIQWPEKECRMILTGVRGEVPLHKVDSKKPFNPPIAAGSVILGCELARLASVSSGGTVQMLGRKWNVQKVFELRGNVDDVTAWVPLSDAQELLNKPGQINAMKALNCQCSMAELDLIPGKIEALLPDVQVLVDKTKAISRTATIERADEESRQALTAERHHRATLRAELQASSALVVPLVALSSAVGLFLLMFLNVRARREEIGLLRAIGVRSGKILMLFMGRAVIVGIVGGLFGYAIGFGVGWWWSGTSEGVALSLGSVFDGTGLILVLLGSPVFTAFASWIPALNAALRDPADVLRAEG
jgi:cell division protein FtsX